MSGTIEKGDLVRFAKHGRLGESDLIGFVVEHCLTGYKVRKCGDPPNVTYLRLGCNVRKITQEEAVLLLLEK